MALRIWVDDRVDEIVSETVGDIPAVLDEDEDPVDWEARMQATNLDPIEDYGLGGGR